LSDSPPAAAAPSPPGSLDAPPPIGDAPSGDAPARPAVTDRDPGNRRARRIGDVAGVLVLLCVIGSLVIGFVPIRNGRVQDCGTPFGFALHGRLDTYPDATGSVPGPNGKPVHLSKAELDDAFGNRCSQRVGHRLAPAAGLTAAALFFGIIAIVGLLVDLSARWRTARQALEADEAKVTDEAPAGFEAQAAGAEPPAEPG
jgi:hypothetical protein